jgi:hypothetical protein
MAFSNKLPVTANMDKSVAAVTSFPLKSHPAVHPFQLHTGRSTPQAGNVVQCVQIKTGTATDPSGTNNYDVSEAQIMDALYKKFLAFSKRDFPAIPRIEAESNATRTNWNEENALGAELQLSGAPLNDYWRLVMDFKKSRDLGAVNIKTNTGEGFSSAIYNQYNKTTTNTGNTDVMVYKHPELDESEEKTASDKGVSYDLAATKFAEIRMATKWKDAAIAASLLQFYKDGEIPDIIEEKGQRRNFGYLATLMTVPESVRSVGTFPFGLMMLENIKNGKANAAQAFTPAAGMAAEIEERKGNRKTNTAVVKERKAAVTRHAKKKDKNDSEILAEQQEIERINGKLIDGVPPVYKDDIDLGGLYAPAYSGSKLPLNTLETEAERGDLLPTDTNRNQVEYYRNTTLKRYVKMVEDYLASHPEQLSIGEAKVEQKDAVDGVISHILAHFGIGGEITDESTKNRQINRASNQVLSSLWGITKPQGEGGKFTTPTLLPEGGALANSLFTFGADRGEKKEETALASSLYQSHTNTYNSFGQNLNKYPLAPSSPSGGWGEYEEDVSTDFIETRTARKQNEQQFQAWFGDDLQQRREELDTRRTTFQVTTSVLSNLEGSDQSRKRKFDADKKGAEDEGGKVEEEEVKQDDTSKRIRLLPPGIRKKGLILKIQTIIHRIMSARWSSEYQPEFVVDSLMADIGLRKMVGDALASDNELKLGDEELKGIVSQEVMGYYMS